MKHNILNVILEPDGSMQGGNHDVFASLLGRAGLKSQDNIFYSITFGILLVSGHVVFDIYNKKCIIVKYVNLINGLGDNVCIEHWDACMSVCILS